jgi:3-deoxy-D-manno-octulosonic-acid transferase
VRRLYTLLLYLALPVVMPALALKAWREGSGLGGWRERLGRGAQHPGGIWIHAASVGEVQAAAILIGALRARWPASALTLSCVTATGRTRARALLPNVETCFAPYDIPGSVRRALARLRPRLLIVIETELWPNLLHEATRAGVPVLLASARVSARSASRYQRFPGLLRGTLGSVWIAAQSAADAERFRRLGAMPEHVSVAGNVKFDRAVPADLPSRGLALRARYAADRPTWIAGSTQEGEEPILLSAHRRLRAALPQALLVLAPRYPQRFEEVVATVSAAGLRCARRSRPLQPEPYDVLVLDTLGELMDFYAAADVAFVGGSLVPVGGHNLLEPAALGLPVLSGPHQFHSPDIARVLCECGALETVDKAESLAAALVRLLSDQELRARRGACARGAIEANRGALDRLLSLIDALHSIGAAGSTAAGSRPAPSLREPPGVSPSASH